VPRVPTYEPNRVAPASTTGARFQAARDPGSIGDGLANFGKSLNDFAVTQDKIDEQFDDTVSRKLTLEYQTRAAQIRSQFEQQEGLNAVSARTQTDAELTKVRDEIFGKATTPRMKLMLEERVSGYYAADSIKVGEHATRQLKAERKKTLGDQRIMAAEMAVANWDSPDLLEQHKATGLAALDDLAAEEGWNEATIKLERDKFSSGIHKAVIDNFMVADDIDAAEAYLDANADDMMHSDELRIRSDLKAPLENRQATGDVARAIGLVPMDSEGTAQVGSGVVATSNANSVSSVLSAAGMSSAVVAGFLGNFQHESAIGANKTSGDGGTAHGLAQWRFDRVDNFKKVIGKHPKNASIDEQARFVAWEMENPQAAGMTTAQRDQILAAKTPEAAAALIDKYYERSNGKSRDARAKSARDFHGGVGTGGGPQRRDPIVVHEAIDALAAKEKWTFERTERAKAKADKQVAQESSQLDRQEDLAFREANEIVIGLGEKFTDKSQIPADLRKLMGPINAAKFDDVIKSNLAPKEAQANGPVALSLNLQAINDPEGFKDMPLGQYVGKVSRAELEGLAVKQANMRKEKPGAFSPRSGIQSAITWGKKYGGVDVKDEDFVKVYDIMEAELRQRYQATNKAPTDAEYEAAFRSATREVKTVKKGVLWDSEGAIPRYKLEADNIPAKDRVKVEARFKAIYGRAPNEEELGNAYRLGKGQYW